MGTIMLLLLLLGGLVSATDRPIIGVVSQWYRPNYFPGLLEAENHTSYIAASYVKWLEAAGAQVVPVIISIDDNEDLTEYFQVFAGVNGLLIPGGATSIFHSGYADASNAFFQMAKEANLAGDFFPIWGTCLGFEMMVLMANEGKSYRAACHSQLPPLVSHQGKLYKGQYGRLLEPPLSQLGPRGNGVHLHLGGQGLPVLCNSVPS